MKHPVLIVGAGPTGLVLALVLTRYNIPVRIIDLKTTAHKESRSLAIHSRTLEIFQNLKVVDQILEKGNKIFKVNLHFNGKKRAVLDFSVLKAPYPFILSLPQDQTEHILLEKLHESKVRVERCTKLIGLKKGEKEIEVKLLVDDEKEEFAKASWVIGCDGVHSTVRRYMGGEFTGYEYPMHFSLADVKAKSTSPLDEMNSYISSKGAQFIMPIKPQLFRVISQRHGDDLKKHTHLHRLEEMVQERSNHQLEIQDVEWIQDFKIHHRISSVYRKGRLFIAGDSAHVHSPVGGQGMNMGIQDAYNLGWKLAYVMEHKASSFLLSSYSRERMPVAKMTLYGTEKLTRVMTATSNASIKYYSQMLKLISKASIFQAMVAYQFSGIATRYKKSPIIKAHHFLWNILPSVKAGCRFFDGELTHLKDQRGTSTFELIENTSHNLFVYFKGSSLSDAKSLKSTLNALGKYLKTHLIATSDQIEDKSYWFDVARQNSSPYKIGGTFMVLVRPDGYIALISKSLKAKKIETYFTQTLGVPIQEQT